MNSRERFLSIMDFTTGTRTMMWEFGYWRDVYNRWWKEGLPKITSSNKWTNVSLFWDGTVIGEAYPWNEIGQEPHDTDVAAFFHFDSPTVAVPLNLGMEPPFEEKVLRYEGENIVIIDQMGVGMKTRKDGKSIPQFLFYPVKELSDFVKLKKRFQPDLEKRLPDDWRNRRERYKQRDYPLALGGYPFGFFGYLRALMGVERLLYSFYDDPKLIISMLEYLTDFYIELITSILNEIEVDCIHIWEDMAYKNGPLISPKMFRDFFMPYYKKFINAVISKGVKNIFVDSDGNISELIPILLDCGVTGLYPFEVAAGMNVVAVRKKFPQLKMMGGIDKRKVAVGKEAIDEELRSKLPIMLEQGGYIPFIDHLVPCGISWENFRYYRERLYKWAEKFGN